jgi:ABC-2 type transport system permease protein
MSALRRLTWIEIKLFAREPMAMIFTFAFPFFVLFVLASVFGNEIELDDPEEVEVWRGVGPTDYYVPAYMGLVMAAIGLITLPMRLTSYREQGVLRRFRAAGVPLPAVLGSQLAVSLGMMLIGAVGIGVASTIVYGTQGPDDWLLTGAGFALSAVMFAAVGIFLGSALRSARAAQGAGLVLFFVMMFISGAGPPRGALNDSMQTLSSFLPLTHAILLLQGAWLGPGWDWSAFFLVTGFMAGAYMLTWRLFRWS